MRTEVELLENCGTGSRNPDSETLFLWKSEDSRCSIYQDMKKAQPKLRFVTE
jgi:hypothetical protein